MYYDDYSNSRNLNYIQFNGYIFEAGEEEQQQDQEQDPNTMQQGGMGMGMIPDQTIPGGDVIPDGQVNASEQKEMEALQKYHLINRMRDLKNRLDQYGIVIEELNMLLKFINFLSYVTILSLSTKIAEIATGKLKENNKGNNKGNMKHAI